MASRTSSILGLKYSLKDGVTRVSQAQVSCLMTTVSVLKQRIRKSEFCQRIGHCQQSETVPCLVLTGSVTAENAFQSRIGAVLFQCAE